MAQMQRQKTRRARQRSRTQRQRARQRERTRRQKTRQENRTRRAEARQIVRQERVKQKGQSGFYSPEGIKARGDVASGLISQGIDIAGMVTTGGLSSLVGDRRDKGMEIVETFTEPQTEPSFFAGGLGGVGGGSDIAPLEDEKPFYQNPLVIGGALVGGFLLYRSFSRRR